MGASFRAFASFAQLSQTLADRISGNLTAGILARGQASFVVPGGTTPGAFFDVLRERDLAWNEIRVTLTDERWVPSDSARSNEALVRTRLLTGASGARLVSLKTHHLRGRDAVEDVDARISAISRPFDVVLAGMGDDGHTASWIPGATGLGEALDVKTRALVCAIEPPAGLGLDERMTLTLPALLDARAIYVLLRGATKRETFEQASAGTDIYEMPVRALMQQDRVPVEFFWSAA